MCWQCDRRLATMCVACCVTSRFGCTYHCNIREAAMSGSQSRRQFLKTTAALAAATVGATMVKTTSRAQPAAATPSPANPGAQKKLGWAFVGIGTLSRNELLPGIAETKLVRMAAAVTGHPIKGEAIVKE